MPNFPKNVLDALLDTVINVFWKKSDMRQLFTEAQVPTYLVNSQDWNAYKYHIAAPILETLNGQDEGLGPLRRILDTTLRYSDCNHLLWLPDGQKRKREGEQKLEHLRMSVQQHDEAANARRAEKADRERRAEEAKRGAAFLARLASIRDRFLGYHSNPNRQERGYRLEEILYDVFDLFELQPRGPFRRQGEQIDGFFVHRQDHFLLEAKWQEKKADLADLRDLDGAVNSSLDNTLGLFISLNGFSQQALDAYVQGNRPRLICMDGADFMVVLEGRIDLDDLLQRMRDLAVQKRIIHAEATRIMTGAYD